jgi:hypothetical protein
MLHISWEVFDETYGTLLKCLCDCYTQNGEWSVFPMAMLKCLICDCYINNKSSAIVETYGTLLKCLC